MELSRDFYVGVVEQNVDPMRKGRIKVRVQTLYHTISIDDIPWAYPFAGIAGKEFQVPAIGKLVNILFFSDDLYSPYYIYSENYNINLQNKMNTLNDDDYVDFGAILFDEITQIYVKHKELTIDLLINKITIDENTHSMNLELKDSLQILNLGSRTLGKVGVDQQVVLGTSYFKWMDNFMLELSNPMSLIGNSGAPIIKSPTLLNIISQYFLLRPNFLSNNVFVVDNGAITILKRDSTTDNRKNDVDLILPPEVDALDFQVLAGNIATMNNTSCGAIQSANPSTIIPMAENLPNAPNQLNGLPGPSSYDLNQIWDPASRAIVAQLHPDIIPYVIKFLNKAKGMGITLRINSGLRTFAQQQTLISNYAANPDSSTNGGIVAQPAAVGSSMHNYGLAIDVSPITPPDWQTIGAIGTSIGFRWGGGFTPPDLVHFDMSFGYSALQLKNKILAGDTSNGYANLNAGQPVQQLLATNYQYNGSNYSFTNNTTPCVTSDTTQKVAANPTTQANSTNTPLGNITTSNNYIEINGPDIEFYQALLTRLGAPITNENLTFLYAWRQSEGKLGNYNPFNTTYKEPGSVSVNSVDVQSYLTEQDGLNATVSSLTSSKYDYSCIVNGLRNNIGAIAIGSCSSLSTWGTNSSLISRVIASYTANSSKIAIQVPPLA